MKSPKWTASDIPDLTDKVALVTGANSGLGFETTKALAAKNARVVMACRNMTKGKAAARTIKKELPGAKLEVMPLDLSSLDSVKAFANLVLRRFPAIDLLINNAGVMIPPYGKTQEGFELQMGTNHMGHFALTGLLLEAVEASPAGRIIAVSSSAHWFGRIDFNDLNWEKRKYSPWKAYGASKIANLYFIAQLNQKLREKNSPVICASAHPGWAATELQRHTGFVKFLNPMFGQTAAMGALPTLYAACGPDVEPNDFFAPGNWSQMKGYPVKVRPIKRARDMAAAEQLWQISEGLTRVRY